MARRISNIAIYKQIMAIIIAIFDLAGNNGHRKFELTGLEDRRISNIAIYWRITATLSLYSILLNHGISNIAINLAIFRGLTCMESQSEKKHQRRN